LIHFNWFYNFSSYNVGVVRFRVYISLLVSKPKTCYKATINFRENSLFNKKKENKKNMDSNKRLIPLITYSNIDINKPLIYKDNRNKSGVYRFVNNINGKSYVGSSISLSSRFRFYYCLSCIKKAVGKESSAIYSAILKYGYSNFNLDILEYCELDRLISREQNYINLLKPEYNILKIASSRFGHKLSKETKIKISISGRSRKISNTFKLKNKKIIKSTINIMPKVITSDTRLKLSLRGQGVCVKVFDKSNNLVNMFPTIAKAALHFDVSPSTISKILDTGISYDEFIYKFEAKDIRV
jgi:group I intron endonuclease